MLDNVLELCWGQQVVETRINKMVEATVKSAKC